MKDIEKRLEYIGLAPDEVREIVQSTDPKAKEYALLMVGMYDDRHEYMD